MMLDVLDLATYTRWDITGIDGLQLTKLWFGSGVDRIAPFQSLETTWGDKSCSVLRLCEGNFRISCAESPAQINIPQNYRGWVKQFDWLGAIAIPDVALSCLEEIAIPKPPYRLSHLKLNCALPARIDGIAVLIWRHLLHHQSVIEIHTTQQDLYVVKTRIVGIES
jgi:hypothetical protein